MITGKWKQLILLQKDSISHVSSFGQKSKEKDKGLWYMKMTLNFLSC